MKGTESRKAELLLLRAGNAAARRDRGETEAIPAEVARRVFVEDIAPIRAFREWRGLTQQQLAELTGTSSSYISQLETRHRRPGGRMLARIAKALRVPADVLVE